jgi:serine/threonine protein kinase
VELLDDGTALKSPFSDADIENHVLDIAKEATIHRRIGPHERLVRLLGHSRDGLVLEYMQNGDLKTYIQAHDSIPISLKSKWAYQVAEAVDLLHRNGVIHCDIKPRNFLLDTALDIKIIDFSGSSIDGSKPASGEGTRFYLPRHWGDQPTVTTDLFALGSTLYEIFQGTSPYEEIPSDELESLFTQKEFPDVSGIPCGQIIKQCWLSQVDSAAHVQTAIGDILSRTVEIDSLLKPELIELKSHSDLHSFLPNPLVIQQDSDLPVNVILIYSVATKRPI